MQARLEPWKVGNLHTIPLSFSSFVFTFVTLCEAKVKENKRKRKRKGKIIFVILYLHILESQELKDNERI